MHYCGFAFCYTNIYSRSYIVIVSGVYSLRSLSIIERNDIHMARKKRIWDPDSFCHIVSRGNRRDALFYEERDYRIFLHILQEVNSEISFELASCCLMTNHFHLLMRSSEQSTSKVMSMINKRNAYY